MSSKGKAVKEVAKFVAADVVVEKAVEAAKVVYEASKNYDNEKAQKECYTKPSAYW